MDKIVIIGSPGAGKSTFARKLGDMLGIKVHHLDSYFWESGWHEMPRSKRIEIQRDLIKNERWIIEGTYLSSSDERLQAADTIIFLDIPRLLCLYRVIKRRIEYNKKPRPDLAEGCPERLRIPYFLKVLAFPERGRRLFKQKQKKLMESRKHEEKQTTFLWLRSSEEVERFLQNPRGYQQAQPAVIEKDHKQTLLPKVASGAWVFVGALLNGLVSLGSSMPYAIINPNLLLEHFKARRSSR